MSRKIKTNGRRIKLYASLIRQVRGKPLLEALFILQDGKCAYDGRPCSLLLHQAIDLVSDQRIGQGQRARFATIDHVNPKRLGGTNRFNNLVMASAAKNCEKGCFPPVDRWTPLVRHTEAEVINAIKLVEQTRLMQAHKLAADRKLNRQEILNKLIDQELRRLSSSRSFKFYSRPLSLVA